MFYLFRMYPQQEEPRNMRFSAAIDMQPRLLHELLGWIAALRQTVARFPSLLFWTFDVPAWRLHLYRDCPVLEQILHADDSSRHWAQLPEYFDPGNTEMPAGSELRRHLSSMRAKRISIVCNMADKQQSIRVSWQVELSASMRLGQVDPCCLA